MSTDTPAPLPAELSKKHEALKEHLAKLGAVAVAFSGGVDSTLLLSVAADVLGDNAVAITARAQMIPAREVREASDFCAKRGIRHVVMDVDALAIPGFAENPADRCYLCKSALFARIMDQATRLGIPYVAEGTNTSDLSDYRPGLKALGELKVGSPLLAAGLSKTEVRALSRKLGLPTWTNPLTRALQAASPTTRPSPPTSFNPSSMPRMRLWTQAFPRYAAAPMGTLHASKWHPTSERRLWTH